MESNKKAFTLLEILLVVAVLAILAGIVILAVNPSRQLSSVRNAQRYLDVNTIHKAVYQYNIDTGLLPPTVSSTPIEICRTGASDCTGLIDLSVLSSSTRYLVSLPIDPMTSSANGTGYMIYKTDSGRPVVYSNLAELDYEIQAGTPHSGATPSFVCGDSISYSGESYPTVLIGSQCWLAKNLNVGSMLCAGSPDNSICNESPSDPFDANNIEKYCYYNNEIANGNGGCSTDGALYTWSEAMALPSVCQSHDTSSPCIVNNPHQGVCPSGWHIPSDADFHALELVYSTSQCDADRYDWQCSPAGTALKVGGASNMNINLPGRRRFFDNAFAQRGANSYLWASDTITNDANGIRIFGWGDSGITRGSDYRTNAFAVRCVKD